MVGRDQFHLLVAAQAVEDEFLEHIVDDCEERHTDDHAHKTPQAAEQQDGEQHPEAGKAGGVAQNLRPDDVAVHLLQNQNEQDEPERLDGVLDEDEQGGRDGTDERPEEGDNVGHTDDDRDQQRTGELEDEAGDVAQHTDDGRIQNLAVDEAAEHPVSVTDLLHDEVGPTGLDQTIKDELALLPEFLPAGQQIHRNDEADDDVLQEGHEAHHAQRCTAQEALHGGNQLRPDEVVQRVLQVVIGRLDEIQQLLIAGDDLLMGSPVHEVVQVVPRRVVQRRHAGDELRHDHHDQRIHHQDAEQQRDGDRQHVGRSSHLFGQKAAEKILHAVAHRLEQIGDDRAVDERHQDARQLRDRIPEALKAVDQEEEEDAQ